MRARVGFTPLLLLVACATPRAGQPPAARARFVASDELLVLAPESRLLRVTNPVAQRYPDGERARGAGADLVAAFVVDTTGRVEYSTISFLRPAATPFVRSVCDALKEMTFAPAVVDGRPRRALVAMPFGFEVTPGTAPPPGGMDLPRTPNLANEPLEALVARLERAPHCP